MHRQSRVIRLRAVAAALAALILAACIGSTPFPTADPIPQPSGSCGGFHLEVHNLTGEAIGVAISGEPVGDVEGGASLLLVQWGTRQLPLLPWTVVITRAADGSEIGRMRFEGDVDQHLWVSAAGLRTELREPPC